MKFYLPWPIEFFFHYLPDLKFLVPAMAIYIKWRIG